MMEAQKKSTFFLLDWINQEGTGAWQKAAKGCPHPDCIFHPDEYFRNGTYRAMTSNVEIEEVVAPVGDLMGEVINPEK